MRLRQHETSNDVLLKPNGSSDAECTSAPITRMLYRSADGEPYRDAVRTYWEPSEAERAAIAAGRPIWVEVWGRTMPPMLVGMEGGENDGLQKG